MGFFDDDEPAVAVALPMATPEPELSQEEYDTIVMAIEEHENQLASGELSHAAASRTNKMLKTLQAQRDAYDEAHDAWVKANYGSEKKEALAAKMAAMDAATASGAITHSTKTKEELHDEVAAALGIREGFNPQTKEEWDWVVNKVLGMQEEQARIQRIAADRIARIEADVQYLKQKYWGALEAFAENNKEPGKQYCQFESGRMQCRNSAGGWVIGDKSLLLGELAKLSDTERMALKVEKYNAFRYEDLDLIKAHCQKTGETFNGSMQFNEPGHSWKLEDK